MSTFHKELPQFFFALQIMGNGLAVLQEWCCHQHFRACYKSLQTEEEDWDIIGMSTGLDFEDSLGTQLVVRVLRFMKAFPKIYS